MIPKIIPFTKKIPNCPKCGHRKVKRRHYYLYDVRYPSEFRWLDEEKYPEFLKLICQACHYEWAQEVKNVNNSKKD